jgi:glycosyltransferase involved in cell wall biosynthesis
VDAGTGNAERLARGPAVSDAPAGAQLWLAPSPAVPVEAGPAPSFSVVIAAYQAAETVGQAVASALEQTLPPLEVIVCDDASTDDIEGALAPLAGRVTLIRRERNGGVSAARNEAVRAASGEFVVILDADDVFMPRRLEALAALASARPDLDILTTDALLEVDGETLRRAYDGTLVFEVDDQRLAILRYNFIQHAAVRRTAWLDAGGHDESIGWTEDWELWIRLILGGSRAGLVTEPLTLYRLNPASLSTHQAQMRRGEVMTLERTLVGGHDLTPEERLALSRALEEHRRAAAQEELREALARGAPDARRRAKEIAGGKDYGLLTRVKAGAAAVFPGLPGRLLRRRQRRAWITAGGMKIERERPRS